MDSNEPTCSKRDREGVRCGAAAVYFLSGDGHMSYYCGEHGERARRRFIDGVGWNYPLALDGSAR